jgi:hypothetical protein
MAQDKNKLIDVVFDQKLIDFFYLNKTTEEVLGTLLTLKFEILNECLEIPFNACVKGYSGAKDNEGNLWLVKKIEENQIFNIRLCELGYLIDFELQTLSAPTILFKSDKNFYRATKIVWNGEGISGYDYLKNPIMTVLVNDLINRWLVFDEDRNPNNYLIIQNSKHQPVVIAIDNGNQDLEAENMKIIGNDEKFGWFRMEKTRFLTLLKPSNYESVALEDIDDRLNLMMNFSEERLKAICKRLFENVVPDSNVKVDLIVSNIVKRRNYINEYFRKWIKPKSQHSKEKKDDNYKLFGESFFNMYKN